MKEINILIFDKDQSEIDLIKGIIKDQHISFQKVSSDSEIFSSITSSKPDLLIYKYIDSTSDQLLNEIRKIYSNEQLKILLLINKVEKKQLEFLFSIMISDIVLIPIEVNSMRMKLDKLLSELKIKKDGWELKVEQDYSNKPVCLLVDSDRNFKSLFQNWFTSIFKIVSVDNGEDAIQTFVKQKVHYVFLADNIKLINEKVLAHKIRELDKEKEVKIFYISNVLKSTSQPSMWFHGVIEKSYDAAIFMKHFNKILKKEKDLFDKIVRLVKEDLGEIISKTLLNIFSKIKLDILFINKNEELLIRNEILFISELVDSKEEISITVGLWAPEKSMRTLLDYIGGEMMPFNQKAADHFLSFIDDIIKSIQLFFLENNLELFRRKTRLVNKNESKLNYDWDIEFKFKSGKNELYSLGVFCSKFV